MKKLCLLFPGQGSQYVGMSKAYESLFTFANDVLHYDLNKIAAEGPEDELKLTQHTQPAIVAHSIASYEKLLKLISGKAEIDLVLGHSVGEYAALACAGVLSAKDAIYLVHNRGKFMQEAVPEGKGKMIAVMKAPLDLVREACLKASNNESQVMPANYNDPDQVVISGHAEACDMAIEILKANQELKFRAIPLKVSAPFHSSLMKPAEVKMKELLLKTELKTNTLPYYANIDAKKYEKNTDPAIIRENLVKQICGSVHWLQSIEKLSLGTICIEVGPGKVLKGLVKKINPELQVLSMEEENFEQNLKELLA
jgi:[acyl-carrier-protein] S-malonyltransferase